uniref:Uncharacterized protein n=1 Tax=Anguilla anguilla TaxID=7936 RepID=A0A0E9QFP9_ANGAN
MFLYTSIRPSPPFKTESVPLFKNPETNSKLNDQPVDRVNPNYT